MATAATSNAWDRAGSAACVAVIHAVAAYLLLSGLGVSPPRREPAESLKLFDVPPPQVPPAAREAAGSPEGAAAPPVPEPRPAPPAPPAILRVALPAEPTGGSPTPAIGTGSGGVGAGYGAGGQGGGAGTGAAMRARRIAGSLTDADYPKAARKAGAQGTVFVRFSVGTDGRARDCTVTETSGNADLDATTCRLIERRFRYQPARNEQGQPVADMMAGQQNWRIDRRR